MNTYLLYKFVHIVAVIVFLGNIFTGLFWMHRANKTKSLSIINHAFKGLIISDRYFTIPGVIIIVTGGIVAAVQGHFPLLRTGWIFWSIILFTISGIVFAWKVAPLQKKIYQMTLVKQDDELNFDWNTYHRFYKAWERWGLLALITPLLALVMMVLKWPTAGLLS